MLGLDDENQSSAHKESTMRRTENDEKLTRSMISVTEERMFNPFQIESEWTAEEPKPLCNIATGLVASMRSLLGHQLLKEMGRNNWTILLPNVSTCC